MSSSVIPSLEPKFFFGLTTGLNGNCFFINNDEIIYPVSGVLVIYNIILHTQKYIHLIDTQKTITAMTLSNNKKTLAIAKKSEKPTISIYDLNTMKRVRLFTSPIELKANSFMVLQFSYDDIYLAVLSNEPDFIMYYYNWENSKIDSYVKAISPPNVVGPVTDMSLNPTDNTISCFVGKGLFRLMTITDSVWRQYGFQKAENLDLTSVCWLNGDRILAGTVDGRIILIENGDLIAIYNAKTTTTLDPKLKLKNPLDVIPLNRKNGELTDIRCCISFKKGLVFVIGDSTVYCFEKTNDQKYLKYNELEKNVDKNLSTLNSDRPLNFIKMLAVSPNYEKIICVTKRTQLFWSSLMKTHDKSFVVSRNFKPLGEDLHHGGIASLSTCIWKPIFITCGKTDHTIRIWNYLNYSLILCQQYQEDIFSVSLHPSGLYSIAAFTGKVEFQLVYTEGLKRWREFSITSCNLTEFSMSGHMFALANQFDVDVYCSVTFEKRFTFKAHSQKITRIVWDINDFKLLTCGEDGGIYEFNTKTGERDMDIVHPNTIYMDLAISKDTSTIYPASQDGRFIEIHNQSITRDIDLFKGALDAITLSKSDLMLFVAVNNGIILSLMLPIMADIKYNQFSMHNKKVTMMKLTIDDSQLITCSEDGSICIWEVKNAEEKLISINDQFTYSNDILVNSLDLINKIETIKELKMRVHELETENKYQLSELLKNSCEKLKELNSTYSSRTTELENKNSELVKKHLADKSRLEMEINRLKELHNLNIEKLESTYNEKLLYEYNKYDELQKQVLDNSLELEKGLSKLEIEKEKLLKQMEYQLSSKLKEKDDDISKLKEQLSIEKENTKQHINKIENDTEQLVLKQSKDYNIKLKELKKINLSLKSELGSYKMKIKAISEETDNLKYMIGKYEEDIEKLKLTVQIREKTVLDLNNLIHERDAIIVHKEYVICEEKFKNKELEKQILLRDENILVLEQTNEPLVLEIQEKKSKIVEKKMQN
ncbi:cilia- and flagella-associated protein 57-like isoform X2 [Daktulosphaira vitifoliae]|uniref:cilia- and flagella-associated protein 57-like isoform X2 n=1 Tax=Daktulosphaira vitifoliae TaxID=58002 RepID=UPI0021A9EE44|nr:cilia- and flagella-associated protein 57-like isoform X2 [Daktulosphaira vitifoliae]